MRDGHDVSYFGAFLAGLLERVHEIADMLDRAMPDVFKITHSRFSAARLMSFWRDGISRGYGLNSFQGDMVLPNPTAVQSEVLSHSP